MDVNRVQSPPCSLPSPSDPGEKILGSAASSDSGLSVSVLSDASDISHNSGARNSISPYWTGPVVYSPPSIPDKIEPVRIGPNYYHIIVRDSGKCKYVALDELHAKLLKYTRMPQIYDVCLLNRIEKFQLTALEVAQLRGNGVLKPGGRMKKFALKIEDVDRLIEKMSKRAGGLVDTDSYLEWKNIALYSSQNESSLLSGPNISARPDKSCCLQPCQDRSSGGAVTNLTSIEEPSDSNTSGILSNVVSNTSFTAIKDASNTSTISSSDLASISSIPNISPSVDKIFSPELAQDVIRGDSVRTPTAIKDPSSTDTGVSQTVVTSKSPQTVVISKSPCPIGSPIVDKTSTELDQNVGGDDTASVIKSTTKSISDPLDLNLTKVNGLIPSTAKGILDKTMSAGDGDDILPEQLDQHLTPAENHAAKTPNFSVNTDDARGLESVMDNVQNTEIPSVVSAPYSIQQTDPIPSEQITPPSCPSVSARAFKYKGQKLHAFNRDVGELISVAEFHQKLREIISNRSACITYDAMIKILDKNVILSDCELTNQEIVFLENNDSHPVDLLRHRSMVSLTALDYAFALTSNVKPKAEPKRRCRPPKCKNVKKKQTITHNSELQNDPYDSPYPSPPQLSPNPMMSIDPADLESDATMTEGDCTNLGSLVFSLSEDNPPASSIASAHDELGDTLTNENLESDLAIRLHSPFLDASTPFIDNGKTDDVMQDLTENKATPCISPEASKLLSNSLTLPTAISSHLEDRLTNSNDNKNIESLAAKESKCKHLAAGRTIFVPDQTAPESCSNSEVASQNDDRIMVAMETDFCPVDANLDQDAPSLAEKVANQGATSSLVEKVISDEVSMDRNSVACEYSNPVAGNMPIASFEGTENCDKALVSRESAGEVKDVVLPTGQLMPEVTNKNIIEQTEMEIGGEHFPAEEVSNNAMFPGEFLVNYVGNSSQSCHVGEETLAYASQSETFVWNNANYVGVSNQELQPLVDFNSLSGNIQMQQSGMVNFIPSADMEPSSLPSTLIVPSITQELCDCARTRPPDQMLIDRWCHRQSGWKKIKKKFKACHKKVRKMLQRGVMVSPQGTGKRRFTMKNDGGVFNVNIHKIRRYKTTHDSASSQIGSELDCGLPQFSITDVRSLQPEEIGSQDFQPEMSVSYSDLDTSAVNPWASGDAIMIELSEPLVVLCSNPDYYGAVEPPPPSSEVVVKKKRGRPKKKPE